MTIIKTTSDDDVDNDNNDNDYAMRTMTMKRSGYMVMMTTRTERK